jgi:hypothetical protein
MFWLELGILAFKIADDWRSVYYTSETEFGEVSYVTFSQKSFVFFKYIIT